MLDLENTTEKAADNTDGFDRLEAIHQRMKREQEAWRKLLERLDKAKQERNTKPTTEKPNP